MARIKEYVINFAPIPWKRIDGRTFYDKQHHEKISTGFYLNQQHGNDPQFTKPIQVETTFYMPIPKIIKDRKSSKWDATFPKIDYLQQFIFDAITDTGVIWKDDRIIASLIAKKLYDKNPRTHIIITELE
jgi:Holliday junction resolvase RusA-like endonuclease